MDQRCLRKSFSFKFSYLTIIKLRFLSAMPRAWIILNQRLHNRDLATGYKIKKGNGVLHIGPDR